MEFEAKGHYWLLVLEPGENNRNFGDKKRLYWGSKTGWATWTEDVSKATQFVSPSAAKSKLTSAKKSGYVKQGDKIYVCEVDATIKVTEI